MSPPWPRSWTAPPVCSTTFASTPGSDCYATSGWPTEPANYPAACCPTRPTAASRSATASGSRKNWRARSRASQRSMRCTSTRSAPNRRRATSPARSDPRAARRRTATELGGLFVAVLLAQDADRLFALLARGVLQDERPVQVVDLVLEDARLEA